ncbi:MAG: hypothetical protein QOF42_972 [Gammaproteobacteria bacterium]|jgi:hypothetical protein|nr:hypothetical protein [Gammaproteobacteria bacterium]
MTTQTKNDDANFSFGVRELRKAKKSTEPLGLDTSKLKVVNEDRGSDPYNTSGSFDRTQNWTRIGRR